MFARPLELTVVAAIVVQITIGLVTGVVIGPGLVLGQEPGLEIPDFTRGDAIPDQATHDWNLGPTGARGWMFSHKMVTTDARQIKITQVAENSPAHGLLKTGDVLLGVSGRRFASDPRTELGKAIVDAETEAGSGQLVLTRWRDGQERQVALQLPILGNYAATAPFHCSKSDRILKRGCQVLAQRMQQPEYSRRQNPIVRCLNGLALLASGDPGFLPVVKSEAEWAAQFSADSFQTWYYGYAIMFLAEYKMATGDESVMPGLRRLAQASARGQSVVGSWGHKFAGDDGRLQGYGMMNSPGIPLTIGLILARQAGVQDPEVNTAIEKSARLLRFYAGKGAVPYGDHHPWTQTHEDNGKCGMAAVMFSLLEEEDVSEFFSRMSLASHGSERDTGHTGNYFNLLWAIPGVARSGPQATGAWMHEYGAWYFDLARRWDGSFAHQGPPQLRPDRYHNWDATSSHLLAYAQPLNTLYLTGKPPAAIPQLDRTTARSVIADGYGWDNKDRESFYDSLSVAELLQRLASWSPIVRERAAQALARREDVPVADIIAGLDSAELETRYGCCQALEELKSRAAPAIPTLANLLAADDLWLRIQAAEALAAIGEPATKTIPQLLTNLARGPSDKDPRGMEQRYLCFALFDRRQGMLRHSLDQVDPVALQTAVRAGLSNQDGRARGTLATVYRNLSYQEIKPLLPAIHDAIVNPAPSGIMFADGIRLAGIELFAQHRIEEGMSLCLDIIDIHRWGAKNRIQKCLQTLSQYGGAAKPLLPRLRQLEKELQAAEKTRNWPAQLEQLQRVITTIETSE